MEKKQAKGSLPKGKFALLQLEEDAQPILQHSRLSEQQLHNSKEYESNTALEPSPERQAAVPLQPPSDITIDQKILTYDKHIMLPNSKGDVWENIKAILTGVAEGGVSHESEFVKAVLKIMDLARQPFYSKAEHLGAFTRYVGTLTPEQRNQLLNKLLPFIAGLALQVELMYPDGVVPLLSVGRQNLVKLSRREVACLLANMFYCTIPAQNPDYLLGEYRFYGLLCDDMGFCQFAINEKLPCLFNYFEAIMNAEPEGLITIARQCAQPEELSLKYWLESTLPLKELTHKPKSRIEEFNKALQVDFANAYIGGGIDGTCLQEQILFVIYPELFVTTLLCERMAAHEAIVITGIEQYSKYQGYSETFKHAGKQTDPLAPSRDRLNRLPRQVVAIDALLLDKPEKRIAQFGAEYTLRELVKGHVGFLGDMICCPEDRRPVASGKWGCGVFLGCVEYKLLIQWIAASQAGRDFIFCSYDIDIAKNVEILRRLKGSTVGQATKLLLEAGTEIASALTANPKMDIDEVAHQFIAKRIPK